MRGYAHNYSYPENDVISSKEAVRRALSGKKLYIFDLDGTVYLGGRAFPFAVDYINELRRAGRRVLFFTNNASRGRAFYYKKLADMGFTPAPGEILTSGDVTADYIARNHAGASVYLLGTPELRRDFAAAGVRLVGDDDAGGAEGSAADRSAAVGSTSEAADIASDTARTAAESADNSEADPHVDIVVTSFDTTLTYARLDAACRHIRAGAAYLCTHPDFNCPTERGFMIDSGAIAAAVTASTGVVPTYFGKPYPTAAAAISALTGVPLTDAVVFGDRLYTDIALGKRSGMTAALVLTGESTEADADALPPEDAPDIVLRSLADACVG